MTDPTRTLVRELIELRASRRSGSIEVRTGDLSTTLALEVGEVVGVKASKPGEPLGRILTHKRLLTQEQYIDVLERMSRVLGVGEKIRFGEVAVELGYVDESAVRRCLTEQQCLLASRVFQGASPTWTFEERPAASDASHVDAMHVEALFLAAVRWADDARKSALGLEDVRLAALEPVWDLDAIEERFDLTDDEAEFARRALVGDRTVAELLDDRSIADTVDVHAILTALVATGAVAPSARRKASAPAPRMSASKRPPPSPSWAIDSDKARTALARIVLTKVGVPAVPTDEASRSVEQQLRSEQAFLRGKERLRSGRTAAALVELERALELSPDSAEYELFVKWTRQAGNAEGIGVDARAELKRLATAALRNDSKLAFGYFILGEVLREEGDIEEARRQLRHALRLDPDLFAGFGTNRARGSRPSSSEAGDPFAAARVVADVSADAREAPPAPAAPASPAPEPAPAPAAPSLARHAMAAARWPASVGLPVPAPAPRPRTAWLVVLVAVLALGGVALALVRPNKRVSPTPAPIVAARVAPLAIAPSMDASAATPKDAGAVAEVSATVPSPAGPLDVPRPSAAQAPRNADAGPSTGATKGVIALGPRAKGHRVFVDGRVITALDDRITVSCGRHELRVGSRGRSAPVDVPCGREIAVP